MTLTLQLFLFGIAIVMVAVNLALIVRMFYVDWRSRHANRQHH